MKQWYTLYTKPRTEFRVAEALQERKLEVFLPEISVGKPELQNPQKAPFFPCYMFMRIDFASTPSAWWQWTPGLRSVVMFDDQPVPMPDYVIDVIKQQLDGYDRHRGKLAQPYKQGELIRITEGPFADMVAIFNGPSTPGKRVQVLLKVLGQLNRVWLDAHHIERLSLGEQLPERRLQRRSRGRGRPIY